METIDIRSLPVRPEDKILDVGCGEGRHCIASDYYFPEAYSIGVDVCMTSLTSANQKLLEFNDKPTNRALFIQADAFKLPFNDASFDHIICSEVLEHIIHYEQVIDEINRLLKPGGTLSISVPRAWPEKICWWLSTAYHQVEGGHVRIFNKKALRNSIEKRKMTFLREHGAHALHVPYWWLRCLFWREDNNAQCLVTRWYHKLLVWDLLKQPWITQTAESLLNPIMGKSQVFYFSKPK